MTLQFKMNENKRDCPETMEIFAPLAHRLGFLSLNKLEDLSFSYLEKSIMKLPSA